MEPRLLDIFVESVRTVVGAFGLAPLAIGEVSLVSSHRIEGAVVSCISLGGDTTTGNMVVSFESETALELAAMMLGEPQTELSEDVLSVVGEVTNMVCGDAKRRLGELGISVGMARPTVLPRGAYAPAIQGDGEVVFFPCASPGGPFYVSIDFGLTSSRKG
jgi:chemotaxis protein CheX